MAIQQEDEVVVQQCINVRRGSSWNALMLCMRTKPGSFSELLSMATAEKPERATAAAFNACADAWVIYVDAGRCGET